MKKRKICENIIGTHLLTHDAMHIVGLDYDEYKIKFLIAELKMLQKYFELSDFYVLQTNDKDSKKPKYHAVCFDKVFIKIYRTILLNTHCDPKFRSDFNLAFGEPKVLRVGEKRGNDKPFLVYVVKSDFKTWEKSRAHKFLYHNMGIIDFKKDSKDDDSKNISYVVYETFRFKRKHQKIFNDAKEIKENLDMIKKELARQKLI